MSAAPGHHAEGAETGRVAEGLRLVYPAAGLKAGEVDDLLLDAFVDDTGGSLDDVAGSPVIATGFTRFIALYV